ncbi:hypothetical protein HMPREF9080_01105 [Cardiobacterium valvarum F0432]|uniref:Uncharacterized protein n=1 Tax=Cardiobacterium valvarum F0432 TaxID=797473 RepID=G9ZEB6_9GAMM|nr:hypothetical protein HMPREF9080_01105 [Cardiobacterium valvarum F0432]
MYNMLFYKIYYELQRWWGQIRGCKPRTLPIFMPFSRLRREAMKSP